MQNRNKPTIIGLTLFLSSLMTSFICDEVLASHSTSDAQALGEQEPLPRETVELIASVIETKSAVNFASLIESGLDVNSTINGLPLIFKFIVDDCNDELLGMALNAGANVNLQEKISGSYPIHWAAAHENDKCFDILISSGADPSVLDFEGRNSYFFALDFTNQAIIEKLYKLNVDLFTKNIYGVDVIHQSVISNQPEFFRSLLLKKLIKPRNKNNGGNVN